MLQLVTFLTLASLSHEIHSLESMSLKLSDPPSEQSLFVIYPIVLVYLTVSSYPVLFLRSGVIFVFLIFHSVAFFSYHLSFIVPPLVESFCVLFSESFVPPLKASLGLVVKFYSTSLRGEFYVPQ